jgi:hypothetical protein
VKTKIEAASGPSQEKERQRLAKMGLFEVPVAGSPYSTLKVEDGKIATLEQRVEMARRHNEIAPHLPKYVKQQTKIQPENNDMARAKKDKGEKKAEAAPATAAAPQSSDECNLKAAAASATAAEQDKLGIAMEEAKARARKRRKAKIAASQPKTAEAPKKPEKPAAKKPVNPGRPAKKAGGGIGGLVSDLLVKKKSNEEILAAVKKDFPSARTSAASIAWYRSKLREEGKLPKA